MIPHPPSPDSRKKIWTALLCFALGVASVLLFQSLEPGQSLRKATEVEAPEKPARQRIAEPDSIPIQPLASSTPEAPPALPPGVEEARRLMDSFLEDQFTLPPVRGTGLESIQRREDSGHIYYEVAVEGLKKEDLNVQVGEGQISISGKIEQPGVFSSFHRSFPLPDGVDGDRAKIQVQPDKLVIELPKK